MSEIIFIILTYCILFTISWYLIELRRAVVYLTRSFELVNMCKNIKCLIILLFVNSCAPNSISNVNTVFELFTPKSLIRFFEFNDQGWNITNNCIKDIYLYLDGLQKEKLWAYQCKVSQ